MGDRKCSKCMWEVVKDAPDYINDTCKYCGINNINFKPKDTKIHYFDSSCIPGNRPIPLTDPSHFSFYQIDKNIFEKMAARIFNDVEYDPPDHSSYNNVVNITSHPNWDRNRLLDKWRRQKNGESS